MRLSVVLLLLSPFTCTAQDIASFADLEKRFDAGTLAYQRRDYAEAVKQWRPLAQQGWVPAQMRLGYFYSGHSPGFPDLREATTWFRMAADAGLAEAQVTLGDMYEKGQGVAVDEREAHRWYLEAAQAGDAAGQYMLGSLYAHAKQMPRDYDEALKWIRKAADQSHDWALKELELMRVLGLKRLEDYAALFTRWKVRAERGDTNAQYALGLMYELGRGVEQDWKAAFFWSDKAAEKRILSAAKPRPTSPARPLSAPKSNGSQEQPVWSGTGFLVTYGGDLVTNYHVVKGCTAPYARIAGVRQQLTVVATDQQNDLALLRLPAGTGHFAVFSDGQRLVAGRAVVVVGFPLMGLLASGANITTGVVSALAGIGDDSRMLQITAPVQPGNSGGPLLDQTGNVVGVVVGKLNALTVARKTGDIPQNVNFAIKGSVVRTFLDVNAVKYAVAPSNSTFDAAMIGEQAVSFTVPIECLK
jgi:S1-C subfamily serine protease